MKNLPLETERRHRRELRRAAALALIATGTLSPHASWGAEEEPKAEEPAAEQPAELKNWVEFSLGGSMVDGDEAAFRQRTGLPEGVFGGVSNFHYEQEVATNTLFKVDGRGIFDNHDYSLKLELNREGLGYLKAGYQEFRTYSDGSGGYLPADGSWYDGLFDDEMAVDRREYWFEAGLRKEKWPEFTIRYSRQEREGRKATTSWGTVGTVAGTRNLVPGFYDLDETRDLVALDARKTLGKSDLQLGFRYEHQDLDNTRNWNVYPGQPGDRHATQRETTENDLFNVHGVVDTRLRENLRFTAGYGYTDLDMGTTGYRVFGTGYDPDLAERLSQAGSFQSLDADGTMSQHVANLNLFWTIAKGLDLIPAVRVEKQDREARSGYEAPASPLGPLPYQASSDRGLLDLSEALELRYSGITNVVLYAKGDWLQGSGDLDETWDNLVTGANLVSRSSDDERTWQKYSLGAAWYPWRKFSLGAGYYHKIRSNDFDHVRDNTPNAAPSGNRYPAYLVAQEYTVDDANVRATWRPRNNLTLVARYDYQVGTVESQADGLAEVESADITSQILSGSVSWVPLKRLYLQGRVSLVQDSTETPVSEITGAVQDAENDYWTLQATAGYAVSDDIDLEASYFYYRADNFADNSLEGMPYGAGAEDQGISLSGTWRLSPRVRWVARYAFVTSDADMYGGYNDYDSHVLQTTLQYRF